MARREALLKLHKRLVARRNELRKVLAGELSDLRGFDRGDLTGDAADAAFDTGSDEISSQLAELEARELALVDRAIAKLKRGTYGMCEYCQKRIPVARLNALPYSIHCIECQREMEHNPAFGSERDGDWGKIYDVERNTEDSKEIDLAAIEMDISGGGR
jgi:RNA polymerase-binding transcription factor